MKKFFQEFKDFALRGNVMDLAIAVIIGAAFGAIVTSLTDNIISPIIGLFTHQNFDLLQVEIFGVAIKYGAFITSVITFIITAFVIFLLVKLLNRLAKLSQDAKSAAAPTTKQCPFCCMDIPAAAIRCPDCTAELPAAAPQVAAADAPAKAEP